MNKVFLVLMVLLMCSICIVSTLPQYAYAGSTSGGTQTGTYCHEIRNVRCPLALANKLTFSIWIATGEVINGWSVVVGKFDTVTSSRSGNNQIDIVCTVPNVGGGYIALGEGVTIATETWEFPAPNEIRIMNVVWSSDVVVVHPHIDNGWSVPSTQDVVIVYNLDTQSDYTLTGFAYHVDTIFFPNITAVTYDHAVPGNFTVATNSSQSISTPFGYLNNGFAYFHYTLYNTTGFLVSEVFGQHGNLTRTQPVHVGGEKSAVDKIGILGPYIGLAVTATIAAVALTVLIKQRKRKQ